MSTYQLGFIGTGNMGGALAQAAAKSGAGMLLSNRTADKAVRLAAELGCAAGTNLEVAEGCKYIFLGVKPQMLQALLAELKGADGPARARLHGGRRYDQDDQRNAGPPLPGRADHAESAGRAWEGRGSDLPGRYCYGG